MIEWGDFEMKKVYQIPVCICDDTSLEKDILTMSNAGDAEEVQEGITWGQWIPKL